MDNKKHQHSSQASSITHRLKSGDLSEFENQKSVTQQLHQLQFLESDSAQQVVTTTTATTRPHVPTTVQIGGKGTVRRRRLRKTNSLTSSQDLSNSDAMYQFMHKFQFRDNGKLERVTFIGDNGTLTSYEHVNLCANLKSHFYHFNLSQYAAAQRKRSKTKLTDPGAAISGLRVDTAQDLLLSKGDADQMDVRELVGPDGYDYLLDLVTSSGESVAMQLNREFKLQGPSLAGPSSADDLSIAQYTPSQFIPDLADDFEAFSNIEEISRANTASPSLLSKDDSFCKFEKSLTTESSSFEVTSSTEEIIGESDAMAAAALAASGSRPVSSNSLNKVPTNLETICENTVIPSGNLPSDTTPPRSDDNVSALDDALNKDESNKKKKKVTRCFASYFFPLLLSDRNYYYFFLNFKSILIEEGNNIDVGSKSEQRKRQRDSCLHTGKRKQQFSKEQSKSVSRLE
jgi:hypothetical protein